MILIGLPVDLGCGDQSNSGSVLAIPASRTGFGLQTLEHMHLRSKMNFKVSFPKGAEFETFRVETEIVWRDVYFWEDWKGYQYALKSAERLNGLYLRLKRLFSQFSGTAETPPQINRSGGSV